jgi:hypothetical protein
MEVTMRKLAFIVVIGAIVLTHPDPSHAQLVLYDDFSSALINPDKWYGNNTDLGSANPTTEAVRLIKSGQLELRLNQYGLDNSDSGSSQGAIRLLVTNPTPITTWQATVTVVSAEVQTCSTNPGAGNVRAGAEIYAHFFNDGSSTGTGDATGDMVTGIQQDLNGTLGEVFRAVSARCANSSCSSFQILDGQVFTTTWTLNQPQTLTLTWDAAHHQFIFSVTPVGGSTETITIPYTQSDSTPPVIGFKVLEVQNAAVNCNGSQKHAFMDALFDKVMVNQ